MKKVVTAVFMICVVFLRILGRLTGLSYKQISVCINLYLQGVLLMISGIMPFVAMGINLCKSGITITNTLLLLLFMSYGSIYVISYVLMCKHYSGNMDIAFDKCVNDLFIVVDYWKISYYMVNIVIFIIWWLTIIFVNAYLAFEITNI